VLPHRVRDTRVINMPRPPSAYDAHQRERWTRHDAHLWIRHDAARWLKPGTDPAEVFPALKRQRDAAENAAFAAKIAASRRLLAALRAEVDELKAAARRAMERSERGPGHGCGPEPGHGAEPGRESHAADGQCRCR
jgi:hypothetical protein